jgi:cytochrome c peroxidase
MGTLSTFERVTNQSVVLAVFLLCANHPAAAQIEIPNLFPFLNPSGISETHNTKGNGKIDTGGPFFKSLGANGRSCFSCHRPDQGWTISARQMKLLFRLTGGTDPVFRTVDGSNCDHNVDTSTVGERAEAYSLLTGRGLFRIGLAVPASADFKVVSVHNPYGCGDMKTISTYRRPLPTTNLKFLSAVMWDARESTPPDTQKISFVTNPADLQFDLAHQAADAVAGHAQGTVPLSPDVAKEIVDFEMHLFTAQTHDFEAGSLEAFGANGGPKAIAEQQFFIGINDPLGGNPQGTPFSTEIFNLFKTWNNTPWFGSHARASVQRGEALFNTRAINITGVGGLNDALNAPVIAGTCGTCHSSPNAGDHSAPLPINIGVSDTTNSLGVGYLPVITLQNIATGQTIQTTDPGRALVTGKWADIGKFKGPVLRGLAARAPYFHNGSAESLEDAVRFYNVRFGIGLTEQERGDLAAFLKTL